MLRRTRAASRTAPCRASPANSCIARSTVRRLTIPVSAARSWRITSALLLFALGRGEIFDILGPQLH